jgi:hypothetical protein
VQAKWCEPDDNLTMHLIENTNKDTIDTLRNILVSRNHSASTVLFICEEVFPVME